MNLVHNRRQTLARLLLVLIAALATTAGAADSDDSSAPAGDAFWRGSAGWWASDNTYLNGELQQKIPQYNSLVHIEIAGDRVVSTTHRFYPPGDAAGYYSQGRVADDRGIELVSVTTMQATAGGALDTVSVSPAIAVQPGTTITVTLSPTVALQQKIEPQSGRPSYHTLVTLPAPDRRYTAMFGIRTGEESGEVAAGDLRGLALYASRRIDASEEPELRERFRTINRVAAVVRGDRDGNTVVELLP